jgi:biopolymer transport protein ExbD
MVLVNFSEADQNERIKLPISELAKPPDEAPGQVVTLQILRNGNTLYNNAEYDLDGLKQTLEFHKRFLNVIKVKLKTVNVIVRADGRCETSKVQDVIDLCQALGFENFKLRAKQND